MPTTPPAAAQSPTEFELLRVAIRENGCFGVLKHEGLPFAVTLERTYGYPPAPKIPEGLYTITRDRFWRGGYDSYQIHVPGHSRLLIHQANLPDELDGCIAVGEGFSPLHGRAGIASSAKGFMEFMHLSRGRPTLQLAISEWR
jgi:hypothetical protein